MLRWITVAAVLALMLTPLSVRAAERTVVLDIQNADCVLCPPIVKRSLMRVPGVKTVDIKQVNKMADFTATVTFNDKVTTVAKLVAAPTDAGYPTKVAK